MLWLLIRPLSVFTGLIPNIGNCSWKSVVRLFKEVLDDWEHSRLFRVQGEVTCIRNYSELGAWNAFDRFN